MTQRFACSIDGCDSPRFCRGWCKRHYCRWAKHGDPTICLVPMAAKGAPSAWIKAHADYNGDDCLTWPFSRHPDGRAQGGGGSKPTRIMCEEAHGPAPSPRHFAVHSCGKGHEACMSPRHLRWATQTENMADARKHKTLVMGEKHPSAKLTEKAVRLIRSSHGVMQKDLASAFGVKSVCIHKVITGKSWKHVK